MDNKYILAIFAVVLMGVGGFFYWAYGNATSAIGIKPGDKAMDIVVYGVNGDKFSLNDQRGKVVILQFMTTACPYCLEEFRVLGQFKGNSGLIIASINLDNTPVAELRRIADNYDVDWFLGSDTQSGIDYKVTAVPTLLVVDRVGVIRFRGNYTPLEQLQQLIKQYG